MQKWKKKKKNKKKNSFKTSSTFASEWLITSINITLVSQMLTLNIYFFWVKIFDVSLISNKLLHRKKQISVFL